MNTLNTIVEYFAILIVIITIHEFSHAWAGNALGDVTAKREGRLTLNPLAHIDPVFTLLMPAVLILLGSPIVFGAAKPVPFNPYAVRYGKYGAALIALAGPTSNLLMASVVGLYLRLIPIHDGVALTFATTFVVVNLAFFVFNMIPFPPLDGSRVLYAVAPPALADAMERIERFGLIGIVLILFLLYPLISPLILACVRGLCILILGHSPF